MMRTASVAVLAIVAIACLVPLTSESSDADTTATIKISDQYVYYGTFVMPEGEFYFGIGDQFMFLDGSEGYEQMQAYIRDPLNNDAPDTDQTDEINSGKHAGELIHAYSWQNSDDYPYINTYDGLIIGRIVLEPYGENLEITVRPGDTFTLTLLSSTTEDGGERDLYVNTYGNQSELSVGSTFTRDVSSLTTFSVGLGQYTFYNDLYVEYTFSYDGGSVPNGSATVFAAICIIIAALVVAALVVAALKPKWSK